MKIFFLAILLAQMGMHAPPVPMTPEQFGRALPGQNVQIAVRVERVQRATIYAQLLRHETASTATATSHRIVLYFATGTPVVMGSPNDVVKGALLYVYGVVTKANHVDAKRVVVDTRFIKVR